VLPIKDDIPTRRFPVLTVAIIVINVLMFFVFQGAKITSDGAKVSDQKTIEYSVIPYEVAHPGKHCGVVAQTGEIGCEGQDGIPVGSAPHQAPTWLTIFTAMFMHGGLLHIAGNMLFLWIFGNNIEDSMNPFAFVVFYLAGGVVATLSQVALNPDSTVPNLGASGAIAAVLGAYALLYPRARVATIVIIVFFVTFLRLPALVVLGLWFLFQLIDLSSQPVGGDGGVAYLAHVGGFAFGLLTIKLCATRVNHDYDRSRKLPVY
jgi:membrane associated rhomboid family serine protease